MTRAMPSGAVSSSSVTSARRSSVGARARGRVMRVKDLKQPSTSFRVVVVARASRDAADAVDRIGDGGAHVAVIGVGTRGNALVDAMIASRALPRAEYWALNADVATLERSSAPNRWRLPPQNTEVTAKSVFENATSAASAVLGLVGKASGETPRCVVVACAGGEASESGTAFVRAIADEKNAKAKKNFFGFKGGARAPEGPFCIAGVVEPFAFEGKRKDAACKEFLSACSSPGTCDIVLTVSQTELINNGESQMSVQDATSIADTSLLFSLLSSCDAARSNCWDSFREGAARDLEAWTPQNDKNSLRTTVNKVMSKRGGGCGVAHAGRGVAEVPTYGSADEATASAARAAIGVAATQSPFLAPGRFDTAYLVMCTVNYGGPTLGPLARETISNTLREITNAEQFIALPKADKRGTTEIEVTLACVTDAETAGLPAPESTIVPFVEADKPKVNAMVFVPGYTEENDAEPAKRKTQKLSPEDLKKFGFGDPKEMVEQLKATRAAVNGTSTTTSSASTASTVVVAPSPAPVAAREESPVVFSFGENASSSTPSTETKTRVRVPLPRDFNSQQVAVRISEPKLDSTGNVVGFRAVDAKGESSSEPEESSSKPERGGIFGWRPKKSQNKKEEKSNLSRRAAGMLEKDRVGADRTIMRMEFANMSVYEGECHAGKREGEGRQVFADGDCFEGKWHNGKPDGKGRLSYKNGGYFEGIFNAGSPNGRGTLSRTNGETFTGEFVDGEFVGGDE